MIQILAQNQPDVSRSERIAPIWHTVVLALLLLVPPYMWLPLKTWFPVIHRSDLPFFHFLTLMYQWILFVFMWLGLLAKGTKFRSLIGKLWKVPKDALRDSGWALLFFVVNMSLALALSFLYGSFYRTPDRSLPENFLELLTILPVMISAGICEEVICRGYLQKQIHSLSGNIWYAILVQSAIFSLAHGY